MVGNPELGLAFFPCFKGCNPAYLALFPPRRKCNPQLDLALHPPCRASSCARRPYEKSEAGTLFQDEADKGHCEVHICIAVPKALPWPAGRPARSSQHNNEQPTHWWRGKVHVAGIH